MTVGNASSNQDLTRREAIVGALAVTSGTVLSDSFGAETASRKSTPRVGIVGAGFAGLACAYELSQAGYVVDLFEARNRLGGVYTLWIDSHRAVWSNSAPNSLEGIIRCG